jgi:hypothetical protein
MLLTSKGRGGAAVTPMPIQKMMGSSNLPEMRTLPSRLINLKLNEAPLVDAAVIILLAVRSFGDMNFSECCGITPSH